MRRDLVFFLSGLSFGVAAGYFVFRAISSPLATSPAGASQGMSRSTIGLEEKEQARPLDPEEMKALEAKARDNPEDAAVRARIGSLYMEAERNEEALKWLSEAVRLAPSDLHARNHLAITYLNLGQLENAVAAFEENLERDPSHPGSLLGLGRIKLYVQRDIDSGIALWEKLVKVAPDSAEAGAVRDELEALKSAHSGS
jgi:tetratricopeptide (TPR) repeat protein